MAAEDDRLPAERVIDEHGEAVKTIVKREAELAAEIHRDLQDEDPDTAALFSPGSLLPKVDDAIDRFLDREDDEDADAGDGSEEHSDRDEEHGEGERDHGNESDIQTELGGL